MLAKIQFHFVFLVDFLVPKEMFFFSKKLSHQLQKNVSTIHPPSFTGSLMYLKGFLTQ